MSTAFARLKDIGAPATKGGDPEVMLATALADRQLAEKILTLGPGNRVLDVGCGYGRLALAFADSQVEYVGLDVNRGRLRYAEHLFSPYVHCMFRHINVGNARYNRRGMSPSKFALDFPDKHFDAAFAISVFTHMTDPEHVRHYLKEIRRCLRQGAAFVATWLTEPISGKRSSDHRAIHQQRAVLALLHGTGFSTVSTSGQGTVQSHFVVLATTMKEP